MLRLKSRCSKAFKSVIKKEGRRSDLRDSRSFCRCSDCGSYRRVYAGEIQEYGTAQQVVKHSHDYTRRLMYAVRPPPAAGQGDETSDEHHREAPALEVKNVLAGYGRKSNGQPARSLFCAMSMLLLSLVTALASLGESGCGKSTLARVMAGLLPAADGQVLLDGEELKPALQQRKREELQKIQFVFQMADTALNPRQRIDGILGRPLEFYLGLKGNEKRRRIGELLDMVELPQEFAGRYPEELSGGQKQRINLARALAASPEVLLCDEVISALD